MLAFKQMCILFITMVSLDFWKTAATSAGELPLISLLSRPRAVTRSHMQAHWNEHVGLGRAVGPRACHSHYSQREAGPRNYSTGTSWLGWTWGSCPWVEYDPPPPLLLHQPPASWPWNRVVSQQMETQHAWLNLNFRLRANHFYYKYVPCNIWDILKFSKPGFSNTWTMNFLMFKLVLEKAEDQISSVAQSCPTLCDPMNHSSPGLPVHHQLPEFTQTRVHRVSDAIQPSHPLSSPSPPVPNPSQHQSLFQWVNSSHEVAKGLEFQL